MEGESCSMCRIRRRSGNWDPLLLCRHEQARASSPTPSQRQAQILQTQLSPQELAFQESMIQEREAEIREIESGIHELHEIFRDLGTLVQEQGGMLGESFSLVHCHVAISIHRATVATDNIESNISSIAVDTAGAAEELTTAYEYQRRAGKRALCLMLVLVVVVCVVLLAVRILFVVARCSTGIPILC